MTDMDVDLTRAAFTAFKFMKTINIVRGDPDNTLLDGNRST